MAKHPIDTRQQIFQAACLLFAEHGYGNVSIRMIAEKAEVQLGSIYYHFENKDKLYLEVFRSVYDLDNALTYDVLLATEPMLFDSPEGKAYAIQRVVFDYFHRHVFTLETWKRRLIIRELFEQTPIFFRLVTEVLGGESEKMLQFYYVLVPGGSDSEAYYWSHLPDTQGLYYLMANGPIEAHYDKVFLDDLSRTIIKRTTSLMISMLDLPVPLMLE